MNAFLETLLEGRRVTLRPLTEEDAVDLQEAVQTSRTELKRRFRWGADVLPDGAIRFIRLAAEATTLGRGLTLAVAEARNGRIAGVASLSEASFSEGGTARLSLWVRSERQGKGYATESGKLLTEHAFRRLGLHRIYARIDPVNRPSRKVLQKLGFRYEGCLREDKRLNGRWVDQECWGLLKIEWKK